MIFGVEIQLRMSFIKLQLRRWLLIKAEGSNYFLNPCKVFLMNPQMLTETDSEEKIFISIVFTLLLMVGGCVVHLL